MELQNLSGDIVDEGDEIICIPADHSLEHLLPCHSSPAEHSTSNFDSPSFQSVTTANWNLAVMAVVHRVCDAWVPTVSIGFSFSTLSYAAAACSQVVVIPSRACAAMIVRIINRRRSTGSWRIPRMSIRLIHAPSTFGKTSSIVARRSALRRPYSVRSASLA